MGGWEGEDVLEMGDEMEGSNLGWGKGGKWRSGGEVFDGGREGEGRD